MKLHSDSITKQDVYRAAELARHHDGADIYVAEMMQNGSRSRARGITFYMESMNGRYATNRQGRDEGARAASWSDYGYFIQRLFDVDPDAIIGYYRGLDDFRRQINAATYRSDDERAFLR